MRSTAGLAIALCMAFCGSCAAQRKGKAMELHGDADKLAAAAAATAASGSAKQMKGLAEQLGDSAFLARLDPPGGGVTPVVRLARVFDALRENPSEAGEAMCLRLARDADFVATPARLNLLYGALAARRPTTAEAAMSLAKGARNGYFETIGPLLAANGSDRALRLLEELFQDESLRKESQVAVAHHAIPPYRTSAGVIAMVSRLIDARIDGGVRTALLESLFAYDPVAWFGKAGNPPAAADWKDATPKTRAEAEALARRMAARADIGEGLRAILRKPLQ